METEVNWTKYYENAYYCTLETKLRSFQIKLFLKCIVFNNTLHGFGLVDSDKCAFCKTDTEDIMHFFYYCPYVKLFWDEVRDWITVITRVSRATIGIRECFLGIIEDKFCPFINCVLLVARFFIYRCKFMNMKPSFDVFFNFLKEIKNSERRIAYKNGDIHKHRKNGNLYRDFPISLI